MRDSSFHFAAVGQVDPADQVKSTHVVTWGCRIPPHTHVSDTPPLSPGSRLEGADPGNYRLAPQAMGSGSTVLG